MSLESFYAPGGGINAVLLGRTPASIELVSKGRYLNLKGRGGVGPGAFLEVPLIQTVPGAAYTSPTRLVYKLGSATRKGHRKRYAITMPKRCPKRHLRLEAELTFAANGNSATPISVDKTYKLPCPRR